MQKMKVIFYFDIYYLIFQVMTFNLKQERNSDKKKKTFYLKEDFYFLCKVNYIYTLCWPKRIALFSSDELSAISSEYYDEIKCNY